MFKDKLKQLRIEKNLTQADVAKALGVSAGTIGNYEQGTRDPQNNEMRNKLADYFDVSIDFLMDKNISNTSDSFILEEIERLIKENKELKEKLQKITDIVNLK